MAVNFQKGWIKVVSSEKMDDEGNHHVEFELADEFIDWFHAARGAQREERRGVPG